MSLQPFSIYLGHEFYTAGAKILIGGIVGDAFVINLLVDLGRPQVKQKGTGRKGRQC